jgi:hypothetical protein
MEVNPSGARTKTSKVLADTKNSHRERCDRLSPAQRMELVFQLSIEALEFLCAGMKAQGFSNAEIRERLRAKRR